MTCSHYTRAPAFVVQVAAKQVSKDGTKKLAYRLSDGQVIGIDPMNII